MHSEESNFGKQTRHKMKEGSMHDEQMKSVLKNNASAVMRITVNYLHFCIDSYGSRNPLIISEIWNI